MITPLEIHIGTTAAAVMVTKTDKLCEIVGKFFLKNLAEKQFDRRTYRTTITYKHYQWDGGWLYFPVNYADLLKQYLEGMGCSVTLKHMPIGNLRRVEIPINSKFVERDHQVRTIAHLSVDATTPAYGDNSYRKGIEMQTGGGKTFSSIKAISNLGYVGLVVAPGFLVAQWHAAVLQTTELQEDDVYVIKGFKSVKDLILAESFEPKIIVAGLETLRLWSSGKNNYEDLPGPGEICSRYGVGTKVMDEVHLNFPALTKIDLSLNIKNNIYLTATFKCENIDRKRIFDTVYPHKMKLQGEAYNRYSNVTCFTHSGIGIRAACKGPRGYSHVRYERQLMKRKFIYEKWYRRVLFAAYHLKYLMLRNDGEKCMIMCHTVDMVDHIIENMSRRFPDEKFVRYTQEESKDILDEEGITIVTTMKSGSTGVDVKRLRTCINTVSIATQNSVLQAFGRLRVLEYNGNPVVTEYVDTAGDFSNKSQVRHWHRRSLLLKSKAKKFEVLRR